MIQKKVCLPQSRSRGERTAEGGFTLVEVLIAMSVLSVGILALAMMMKQSVSSTDYGRKVTAAENLAIKKLEELKMAGYLSIPAAGANPAGSTFATQTEAYGSIPGYLEYQREVNCTILQGITATAPHGFLKRVTVTVRWAQVGSIAQAGKVDVATIVSQ